MRASLTRTYRPYADKYTETSYIVTDKYFDGPNKFLNDLCNILGHDWEVKLNYSKKGTGKRGSIWYNRKRKVCRRCDTIMKRLGVDA